MFLQDRFLAFLHSDLGVEKHHKVLLAVSGGMDSVCMLHLFHMAGYDISVAHCNFSLRGEESDTDASWLRMHTETLGIPYHEKKFDTAGYAEDRKISIQESARDLRYAWFHELSDKAGYDFIATAHHANDQAETILLNLTRGTGIKGMKGISLRNGKVIRPLLHFSRKEIESYVKDHHLPYRTDSSNASDHYSRNYIRHHVIPHLEEINPAFIKHASMLAKDADTAYLISQKAIDAFRSSHCIVKNEALHIPTAELMQTADPFFFLFHLISALGFSAAQCQSVLQAFNEQSGKRFLSGSHSMIKDRASLIITPLREEDFHVTIPQLPFEISHHQLHLRIEQVTLVHPVVFDDGHFYMALPPDGTLHLTLRGWQAGDKFMPLGMTNQKKISDYFIDKKISIPGKKEALILLHDKDVLALIPHQIDERYKVSAHTTKAIKVSLL